MRINEAYMSVLSDLVESSQTAAERPRTEQQPDVRRAPANSAGATAEESFFEQWKVKSRRGPDSSSTALAAPKDPAYTYYKAGFRYYRLGASELFHKDLSEMRRSLVKDGTTDLYILRLAIRALHYFERSYSYFFVVVNDFPESPWSHDARWKLRRLEKFSTIYQRICENLSRRSSTSRSSFSMARGADPS